MAIRKNNNIQINIRIKEMFFDFLIISAYLLLLFCISMIVYTFIFKGIPELKELQAQAIALFTSVIPIFLFFSYMDYSKDGSFGKRKAGLKLVYEKKTITASLLRNFIKFLPWQIGHMSTIRGIYTNFDSLSIVLSIISIIFGLLLLLMAFFRKDRRHLGDILAKTQVQI